jgi:LysM repeat protein
MTRAELQHLQDQTPPNQYFARVEGRNNGGLSEYRAVRKPLPSDQYSRAEVSWGLDDKELYAQELLLLRTGSVRKSMQVFVDASGTALHQIVWLRPLDAVAEPVMAAPATTPGISPGTPVPPLPPVLPVEPSDPTAGVGQIDATPAANPETTPPADATPPETTPPVAVLVPSPEQPQNLEESPQDPQDFTIYTVVKGDVLEKIARRHHTTVEAIMTANERDNDRLQIGQKLKIPKE